MAEMRRFGLADMLCLLLVLAAGAGTRVAYLMTYAAHATNSGPIRVQEPAPTPEELKTPDLEALIASVKDGGFSSAAPFAAGPEPTAHVAPGYPYLVGLLAKAVPSEKRDQMVRWIQAGLGTLAAGLYFLFARRAFRSLTAGLLAGLFAAANPFWVITTATIDDGTLAIFVLAGCLFLAGQAGEKGGAFLSLLLGLSLAGLALVRASFLPFSFACMIWFLVRSRSLERGWLCALVAFLGFLTGLTPWTIRNLQTLKEPIPVVSSVYLHLWIGNNPRADGGPATPEMWRQAPAEGMRAIRSQPARYNELGQPVLREFRFRPEMTVRRRISAFLGFFVGAEWVRTPTIDIVKLYEDNPPPPESSEEDGPISLQVNPILQAWLAAMLGLGLIGWRWSYAWRWESFPATLAMFWVPLPYILSHAEGLSGPRLPLDGVLMCYAALVLAGLIPGSTVLNPDRAGPAQDQE